MLHITANLIVIVVMKSDTLQGTSRRPGKRSRAVGSGNPVICSEYNHPNYNNQNINNNPQINNYDPSIDKAKEENKINYQNNEIINNNTKNTTNNIASTSNITNEENLFTYVGDINKDARNVHTVQGVKVWNNVPLKKKRMVIDAEEEMINVNNKNSRRKRGPARKLTVDVDDIDIWLILKQHKSDVRVAQLLKSNKKLAKDVVDGIRFMHGRKNKNDVPTVQVNHVGYPQEEEGGASEDESFYLSDAEFSEVESEVNSTLESFNDTEDENYKNEIPYDTKELQNSKLFVVPVELKGVIINGVIDTGAAISVISSSLVGKMNLEVNKNIELSIENMNETMTLRGGICESVPIRIGGLLRSENMLLQKRADDLLILGMSWLKRYEVIPNPSKLSVQIPIKKDGKANMVIQGDEASEEYNGKSVYHLTVNNTKDVKEENIGNELYWGEDIKGNKLVKDDSKEKESQDKECESIKNLLQS
ncbi:unnamed protein product [Cunninghamella echinulata]